ncbi:MAG: HAD family hydrolase, partial [Firmicutes bacterium]|nr:HAD family hydrolase [Candidatus Caballimonas caccae]
MKKLVIFDLDGTLLHTVPDIMDSINYMLQYYGYKNVSYNDICHYVGNGARNLVSRCIAHGGYKITEEELDERLNFYNEYYTNSNSPKTKLFDGIGEVLIELKKRGYYIAILTNKPQVTTNNVYETYLKDYNFDRVIGSTKEFKIKPDKETTVNLMKEFSVEPKNTYFVGDGETDVVTSINAGTNGIAVLWGYRSKEELKTAGAKVFIEAPKDLLN